MNRHACWLLLLLLLADAGCCCCCWLLLLDAAQQQPEAAAAATSSSQQQQPAAASSRAAAASMAAAWACCCFKTGMHGAWHAAASKPGCMVHGMSLQQQQLLRACMRACVAAFVIDTIYELTRRRRPRRGESNFRMEISTFFGRPLRTSSGGSDSPRLP